jgi:nucleoside-diphosphate-sugar epimerase
VLPDDLRRAGENHDADGYMDITRAREEFGVVPAYDIRSGVRQYAGWLREHEL